MIAQFLAALLGFFSALPDSLPTAAVVSFEYRGVASQDADILADRFRSELGTRNAYRLLERNRMDEILREQGFQQSGCTSTECAVQTGRLLGVERMIAGSIAHLGNTWSVSAREIDVETGEILRSAVVDLHDDVDHVLTQGMGRLADRLLGKNASVPGPSQSLFNGFRTAFSAFDSARSKAIAAPDSSRLDSIAPEEPLPPIPEGSIPFQFVLAVFPLPPAKSVHGVAVDVGWGRVDHIRGFQVGIVNQTDSALYGVQGGVVNITKLHRGVQAGVFGIADSMRGIQAGAINFSGPLKGMQAGAVNVAGESDGFQVGLVNIWKKDGVSRISPFVGGFF